MRRALLKKQLMEVFSWLYKDRKSGRVRRAGGLVAYVILYIVLFAFLAGVFALVAVMLCGSLHVMGLGWMYWCIMGLIGIFMGVFGSVFNTYASLYTAKDNDLLLSMPIPVRDILLARLSGVYAMGALYEGMVMVPTMIVWWIVARPSIPGVIFSLFIPVLLSLFVLVLSAALGYVVARIATRLRHKNILTVVISLAFLFTYYWFYAQSMSFLEAFLAHASEISDTLRVAVYPLYLMGRAAEGDALSMLGFVLFNLLLLVLTVWLLSRSFLRLATTVRGEKKTVYQAKRTRARSLHGALLTKELRRFTGSANYMLNCGLGTVMMPIAAAFLLIKRAEIGEVLSLVSHELALAIVAGAVCTASAMNTMAAPSISLEGKNLYLLQSMPVLARDVLRAKVRLQVVLTLPPAAILAIVSCALIGATIPEAVIVLLLGACFIVAVAEACVALNLKMPDLTWTSETVPIKQDAPAVLAIFGGWALVGVSVLLYVLLDGLLSGVGALCLVAGIFLACAVLLRLWLSTRGARIFAAL